MSGDAPVKPKCNNCHKQLNPESEPILHPRVTSQDPRTDQAPDRSPTEARQTSMTASPVAPWGGHVTSGPVNAKWDNLVGVLTWRPDPRKIKVGSITAKMRQPSPGSGCALFPSWPGRSVEVKMGDFSSFLCQFFCVFVSITGCLYVSIILSKFVRCIFVSITTLRGMSGR